MRNCLFVIIVIITHLNSNAQFFEKNSIHLNYNYVLNKFPIKNTGQTLINYKNTQCVNLFWSHHLKNSQKISLGLTGQTSNGESQLIEGLTYDCTGINVVPFTKYYKSNFNVYQLFFSYELSPKFLNSKSKIRVYLQSGFLKKTFRSYYSPEFGCYGYNNTINEYKHKSFSGAICFVQKLLEYEASSLHAIFGVNYQAFDQTLFQYNFIFGLEYAFGNKSEDKMRVD